MKLFNLKHAKAWAYAVPLAASLLFQPANQLYAVEAAHPGDLSIAGRDCVAVTFDDITLEATGVVREWIVTCGEDSNWVDGHWVDVGASCDPDNFGGESFDPGSCEPSSCDDIY